MLAKNLPIELLSLVSKGSQQNLIDNKNKPDACFDKSLRLLNSNQFKHVMNTGIKFVFKEVVFFVVRDEGAKLGIVVTKKIGNAVKRNLIKRRLREVFRQRKSQFEGFSIVALARKYGECTYESLDKQFLQLEKKLQAWESQNPCK